MRVLVCSQNSCGVREKISEACKSIPVLGVCGRTRTLGYAPGKQTLDSYSHSVSRERRGHPQLEAHLQGSMLSDTSLNISSSSQWSQS